MSDSSEGIESRSFYENSDGDGSAISSLALGPKRPHSTQIVGMAWVLRGEITINLNQLLSDSFDAKVQDTKSQLQAALGAKFENLFGKMWSIVSYFVIFCNLSQILHVAPAATTVKIQIRGFLQIRNPRAKTGLDKLLSPTLSFFLAGEWDRCQGGLCGNKEYENCMRENSSWLAIQSTGIYRATNRGKCAKWIATAQVIASYSLSVVFFITNVEIRKIDPSSERRSQRRFRCGLLLLFLCREKSCGNLVRCFVNCFLRK